MTSRVMKLIITAAVISAFVVAILANTLFSHSAYAQPSAGRNFTFGMENFTWE